MKKPVLTRPCKHLLDADTAAVKIEWFITAFGKENNQLGLAFKAVCQVCHAEWQIAPGLALFHDGLQLSAVEMWQITEGKE